VRLVDEIRRCALRELQSSWAGEQEAARQRTAAAVADGYASSECVD
jgi:hypothetical protein